MSKTSDLTVPPGLVDLSRQQALPNYARDLWRRREFAWVVPLSDVQAQKTETVLGNLWHVLNPLFLVGTYFLLFGVLLGTDRGVENFLAFLAIGVFVFHYSSRSLMAGATSIVRNTGLIRAIPFPRALLPVSAVVGQGITFVPALLVMLVVAVLSGERPALSWLALPAVLALQTLFNFGGAFFAARATAQIRDVASLLPFLLRLVFYGSGVLYSVDRFIDSPTVRDLFLLNPFYVFVELSRAVLMGGFQVRGVLWLAASAWAVGALLLGFLFFRGGEAGYGRG